MSLRSHVTLVYEACHTHLYMRHITCTRQRHNVMDACILWMSHVAFAQKSCHVCTWVMSHTYKWVMSFKCRKARTRWWQQRITYTPLNSFICVCDMTPFYTTWLVDNTFLRTAITFICVTWLIRVCVCNMTPSYVTWLIDSIFHWSPITFICVTWLFYMCVTWLLLTWQD